MLLMLTAIAAVSIGYDLSRVVWPAERHRMPWAERLLYASLTGIALWLATAWLIAFLGVLNRPVIIGRTLAFLAVAIALRVRAGGFKELASRQFDSRKVLMFGLPLLPLFLWCIFMLWRSVIVPPLSHDALSYHLPKAALWIQAGGWDRLEEVSFVIGPRPSNYEMLIADAILLDGGDVYTEWLGTIFYLVFILASVAMAQRWWGDDAMMSATVALLTAAVPVAMLQSGAHKNDVMASYFMVAAAVAAGRWISSADFGGLALAIVALVAAAGTKQHGAVLAVFLAPLLLARMFRAQWNWRRLAAISVIAILSVALLGAGVHYLRAFVRVASDATAVASSAPDQSRGSSYGDWANLWIGPWALLAGPFSFAGSIAVPGHGRWYWRRYEIYFSHLGVQFVAAALLLIPAMLRYRKQGSEEVQRERWAITSAVFAAFVAILPFRVVPIGIHVMNLPRFVLFIVPVMLAWTVAPAVLELVRRGFAKYALAAASIAFVLYGVDNAMNDTFVPPSYVEWAMRHPGTRVISFDPNRATSIVDRIAGPRDTVAVDCATSTWTYPAFGEKLTRRVMFVPPRADGTIEVPDAARWVAFDRSWKVIWGDARFQQLADADKYLAVGALPAQDLAALRQLHSDRRFRMVWANPRMLQAVFLRRR